MRTYIFGPVPSRRLGISLGVDLTPTKTCTYDCLYCQLNRTSRLTATRGRFCDPEAVIKELKEVLQEIARPDWVTISGTGEPTLHSDLGVILAEIKKLHSAPVCVITNASLMHMPEVRKELLLSDRLLPTVSTVNESTFTKIHRPAAEISLKKMLEGLRLFSEIFSGAIEVEVFVCPGLNDSDEEIAALRQYLMTLNNLESVYLNAAVRVPLDGAIVTADQGRLNQFRESLQLTVPVTTAFEHSHLPPRASNWNRPAASSDILKLLLRHPCSEEQLEMVLGSKSEKILALLEELKEQDKIEQGINGFWKIRD